MFEYPLVPGVTRETRAERGLPFPAYGVPSKEAEEGVDGRRHPRAGPRRAPTIRTRCRSSASTSRRDRSCSASRPAIWSAWIATTSRRSAAPSPGALVAGRERVYVANATNDTISVIDAAERRRPGGDRADRAGSGAAARRAAVRDGADRRRNAALRRVRRPERRGGDRSRRPRGSKATSRPAGFPRWSRSRTDDGRCSSAAPRDSARGRTAAADSWIRRAARTAGRHHAGHAADRRRARCARARGCTTQQVIANTYQIYATRPLGRCRRSSGEQPDPGIKHVVFIVKENRTFDQVFGGGVAACNGDASLAELGGRASPESSGARGSLHAVRQLLLRQRSVEHRSSLGRRRLSRTSGSR